MLMPGRNPHQSFLYIRSKLAPGLMRRRHGDLCTFVQDKRFREYSETLPEAGNACLDDQQRDRWSAVQPLTDEDIRIHAWLSDRLAELHYQRYGLWPRLRRLLFGHGSPRSPV